MVVEPQSHGRIVAFRLRQGIFPSRILCKSCTRLFNPAETVEMALMDQTTHSPLGLSTSQAAHALGVSLGTIRRWSDMGYLESYRTPGGQRRFSNEQIQQFLSSLQPHAAVSAQQRAAI
jgi:excisionase family DNA binding protein